MLEKREDNDAEPDRNRPGHDPRLCGFGSRARADEELIQLDKVPAAVMKAVKAKFPGAELKKAARETEDGKTLYEVTLTHDGSNYDVALQENGTFAEIEKEIKAADLPKPVTDAVKAKYPRATMGKVEEITKGETKNFEVHLKDGDTSRELVLSAAGKILEQEDGEEGEDEKEDDRG